MPSSKGVNQLTKNRGSFPVDTMTEEAFQSLKRALARSVSLAYLWPDSGFYYLDMDAS